jgi:hypothetical protein
MLLSGGFGGYIQDGEGLGGVWLCGGIRGGADYV